MNVFSKKNKIGLFMLPLLTQGGGAEKYFINLAKNLSERGYQTDIITTDESFFRKFARFLHIFTLGNFFRKIDISGCESEEDISRLLGKARWRKTSYGNLKKTLNEYDVIYTKNEIVDLVLLKRVGYKKLPPVIVGIHTPVFYTKTESLYPKLHNFLYSGILYKWLLKGSKCVHVSNKFAKKAVEINFKIRTELIYFPFSTEEMHEMAEKNKSEIHFDAGKKNIIFAGRIGREKGMDVLMDIINGIGRDENMASKICFNIFGGGNKKWEDKIRNLSKKYSFVRYFGHVENKYIPDILGRQDIMVAPSKWETLSYSIIEAQAMGIPVVAFDIPGPNEFIIDGVTGLLAKNEEDFYEKIIALVYGTVVFKKESISDNIKRIFEPAKIYDEIIRIFKDVYE